MYERVRVVCVSVCTYNKYVCYTSYRAYYRITVSERRRERTTRVPQRHSSKQNINNNNNNNTNAWCQWTFFSLFFDFSSLKSYCTVLVLFERDIFTWPSRFIRVHRTDVFFFQILLFTRFKPLIVCTHTVGTVRINKKATLSTRSAAVATISTETSSLPSIFWFFLSFIVERKFKIYTWITMGSKGSRPIASTAPWNLLFCIPREHAPVFSRPVVPTNAKPIA